MNQLQLKMAQTRSPYAERRGFSSKRGRRMGDVAVVTGTSVYHRGADLADSAYESISQMRPLGARTGSEGIYDFSGRISGPRAQLLEIETALKEMAFDRDDFNVKITVFAEGGWFSPRSIGFEMTGPKKLLVAFKKLLEEIAAHE